MNNKYIYRATFIFLLSNILFFGLGLSIGNIIDANNPIAFLRKNNESDISILFQPYQQVWDLLHDQYLIQPLDDTVLMQGSIKGMLNSLGDPYTTYLNPDEFKQQSTPLEGEYTGIGAWVDTSGDALVFLSPMPNSPAEEAGIQPGDKVIAIDDEDVTSIDPSLVLRKVLGPAETQVKITVQRDKQSDPIEFFLIRKLIVVPSVESSIIEENIGYVRLFSFGAKSYKEISEALQNKINEGATRIILDLRNNTGGYVDAALDITSIFIQGKKPILIEESGDGEQTKYLATKVDFTLDIPMIILVNEGTASASEILAGALQDYERAKLIGQPTFGKGLIQNWIPLDDDNGAVRITIARWLTPLGRQIQGEGLQPDIIVQINEEDFFNGIDAQLEKAIEIIQSDKKLVSIEIDSDQSEEYNLPLLMTPYRRLF